MGALRSGASREYVPKLELGNERQKLYRRMQALGIADDEEEAT
jgi:hypothetical protein